MKKIVIDQTACISCRNCASICPEVFRMNEDELAEVYRQPEEITERVLEAIEDCPTMIITIEWE